MSCETRNRFIIAHRVAPPPTRRPWNHCPGARGNHWDRVGWSCIPALAWWPAAHHIPRWACVYRI